MNKPEDISNIVKEMLKLEGRQELGLPKNLMDLIQTIGSEEPQKIEIYSITSEEDVFCSQGPSEKKFMSGPYHFEKKGLLIGESINFIPNDQRYDLNGGHKLYLFEDKKLGLFSYEDCLQVLGRNSGPGYTGSEESREFYKARLEREFRFSEGNILLDLKY